jgi:hypothetical protein
VLQRAAGRSLVTSATGRSLVATRAAQRDPTKCRAGDGAVVPEVIQQGVIEGTRFAANQTLRIEVIRRDGHLLKVVQDRHTHGIGDPPGNHPNVVMHPHKSAELSEHALVLFGDHEGLRRVALHWHM